MQTILKLIGEGGGYCIEGEQDGSGWRFRVARNPEVWRRSLQDVLLTINQGWPGLYPETIHPEFRVAVWELFCAADRPVREDRVLDWRERCMGCSDADGDGVIVSD